MDHAAQRAHGGGDHHRAHARARHVNAHRAGRFRSLGDGQVDFSGIFSKLTQYGYGSWAVLEWECALKHPEDGAREGAEFIKRHIIRVTEKAFDDFAGSGADDAANRRMLGLSRGA